MQIISSIIEFHKLRGTKLIIKKIINFYQSRKLKKIKKLEKEIGEKDF